MAGAPPRCTSFRITRRQGCVRSLNWSLDWRIPLPDATMLAQGLQQQGFLSRHTVPGLFHGEDPSTGDQVLLVLRTSRIEVRVPYTFPPQERPRAAVLLAHRVARVACALLDRKSSE